MTADLEVPALPTTFTSGSLVCPSPFLLAPMESVTDVGYRALCASLGAGFVWTEMIRARGIVKRNRSTLALIDTFDSRVPTGLQLLVTGPEELRACLAVLEELSERELPHLKNIQQIDLNFGCPSDDVIRIGAGPALLKRRSRLRAIFEALAEAKKSARLPLKSVSAKIRLGLNAKEQEHKVYLPVVEMAQDTLDHLTVHARHAKQRSRDAPTWAAIAECKRISKIPIVGNGDVRTRADAARMYEQTGCDAFLIARAAIDSPWCFAALRGERTSGYDFTADEVSQAGQRYRDAAARFGTKEKFRAFHEDGFARLGRIAAGAMASAAAIPKNAHMQ